MAEFLHIIKTNFYKNDTRVTKWINSLSQYGCNSEIFILQDDNDPRVWEEGKTRITASRLYFRNFFPKRRGYLLKIPEFTIKSLRFILSSNAPVVIFHDMQ